MAKVILNGCEYGGVPNCTVYAEDWNASHVLRSEYFDALYDNVVTELGECDKVSEEDYKWLLMDKTKDDIVTHHLGSKCSDSQFAINIVDGTYKEEIEDEVEEAVKKRHLKKFSVSVEFYTTLDFDVIAEDEEQARDFLYGYSGCIPYDDVFDMDWHNLDTSINSMREIRMDNNSNDDCFDCVEEEWE